MKKLKTYLHLAAIAGAFCLVMTGCGTGTSTTGNNTGSSTETNNAVNNAANNVGDAAKDVANGVGNAAKDVTTGVGDAVNDLVGNGGFNTYADAHDYFLDTMGAYHSDAAFELREEDKNLTDYQEGSKGYHFTLYDTSKNKSGEMFGEFYVDATSGTIYKKGANNTLEEYPAGRNGNTTTSNQKTSGTGTGNLSENR